MGTNNRISQRKRPDLLIIAGEHSGDQNIAQYIKQLKTTHPELVVYAFGGQNLAEAGARLLLDMTKFSVVGLTEVILKYFFFRRLLKRIIIWIKSNNPRVVCLVDYPGLNLRIARLLFKEGISNKSGGPVKVLYYISPQIWAWKSKRRFLLEKYVDSVGTIFEFEKECYRDTSLDVRFVGHPFDKDGTASYVSYSINTPILLLPGSRVSAVRKIFPEMLRCFREFSHLKNNKMATVMYADHRTLHLMRRILNKKFRDLKGKVSFIPNGKHVEACATIMSSGTMSLRCCLAGIPGVILYKSALLTFLVGKYVLKLKRLGIANILLGKNIWPEFIQNKIDPRVVAQYVSRCIDDPEIHRSAQACSVKLGEIVFKRPDLSPIDWVVDALEQNS